MLVLESLRQGRCSVAGRPVLAGPALRPCGAHLIGLSWERCAQGIVTSQQAALIADPQGAIGELVDDDGAAHEMGSLAGGGQLQDEVVEGHGIVVTDDPAIVAGEQQVQLQAGQLGKGAFLLRWFDGEAAIEVGDKDLFQILVGLRIIGNQTAACIHCSSPAIAFVITSRRVIARASRHTRRSVSSTARLYPTPRTSLNVYAPDISYVCDKTDELAASKPSYLLT